jgi:hypothetical protein
LRIKKMTHMSLSLVQSGVIYHELLPDSVLAIVARKVCEDSLRCW